MIRQPTPPRKAFAWWNAALRDPRTPRHEGEPQAGYYKRRTVKNGPWVPLRIRLVQAIDRETGELTEPEIHVAEQDGASFDPNPIWTHCRPISSREFNDLTARQEDLPLMAATHAPVDLSETPIRPGA
ncbi:hypothetical protein [Leisingera methylohalidivorans]|uniref:Uncharacterized protein n=1 Tax=Leisingera methylohalidivorans DSM 14336 TaxID=999552 RepID=V9VYV2_9RHOB|nr:hypothetical protein [Leisingera methylohalidivorans]AHD02929.1 hypothetical protein METH_06710 [Leisingera methylohalidivorans DSM 14336]